MPPTAAERAPAATSDVPDTVEALLRALDAPASTRSPTLGWRGNIATRWTAVAHFERDGERYVLARASDPSARIAGLSRREEEVLAAAARGCSNKVIAYDLGISASTVRVLLSRVRVKLGAATCADAVRLWQGANAANDP